MYNSENAHQVEIVSQIDDIDFEVLYYLTKKIEYDFQIKKKKS